jgi:hypothetical protein
VLLPHLAGAVVQETELTGGLLCIRARARADEATCPSCERASRRVHSRYERRLADAPVGGRRVVIRLQVRRLFCDVPACAKRTFAEQVPGLTARYGRKTGLLAGMQQDIAVALAGRAGCRLARSLQVPASRQVLLRLVMAVPDPVADTPRVLGVDDFAIRRGQNYGTVLIDCQTGVPLELLAGRDARPLADWLAAHPGVEVICRDRSGAYADGARTGAPDAIQVADRFHLWQNLAKAVERCVGAHRGCLREPAPGPVTGAEPGPPASPAQDPRPAPEPAGKFAERACRHHALVHELLAEGRTIRAIAGHLGWGRHTVQRYARAATWQELADGRWQTPRPSMLDPFKPHLDQRTAQGCGNGAQLFREITALGYTGSYSTVRDWLDQHRPAPAPLPPPPPTVREVTGWLTRHPDSLTGPAGPLPGTPGRRWPGTRVRRHAHPAQRAGTPAVDQRRQGRRAARPVLLRYRARAGPGRRYLRPDQPVELRACRGPRQPHQDDQTADVRPGRAAAAPQTRAAYRPGVTGSWSRIRPEIWARSQIRPS